MRHSTTTDPAKAFYFSRTKPCCPPFGSILATVARSIYICMLFLPPTPPLCGPGAALLLGKPTTLNRFVSLHLFMTFCEAG